MNPPLLYLAHPVRPEGTETIEGNLVDAESELQWLLEHAPQWDVICPWLAEIRARGGDLATAEVEQRERGMARNLRVVRRCDGIILSGPRISDGMTDERKASLTGLVVNLTGLLHDEKRVCCDNAELTRLGQLGDREGMASFLIWRESR